MKSVCDTPYFVSHTNPAMGQIPVPCGKCPPCKYRRVNAWVFRLLQEEKVSVSAYFVTLTYAIHSVPITKNGWMTLDTEDLRLYIKRLRKSVKQKYGTGIKIKYFAAGEYGTDNKRPHYHLILFNVPDVTMIANSWSLNGVPIGHVDIGNVSSDSIAYTMKYIDKSTWSMMHSRDDRYPEFQRSSQGLGISYLTPEVIKWHRSDVNHLFCSLHEGHRIAIPRYYKRKIFTDDEVKLQLPHIQKVVLENEVESRRKHYLYSEVDYDSLQEQRKRMVYQQHYKHTNTTRKL